MKHLARIPQGTDSICSVDHASYGSVTQAAKERILGKASLDQA